MEKHIVRTAQETMFSVTSVEGGETMGRVSEQIIIVVVVTCWRRMKMKLPKWKNLVNWGKHRKKVQEPLRERLLLRKAIIRCGLNHRENVMVWNPFHMGASENLDGGVQWLDFVIRRPTGGLLVVLFPAQYLWGGGNERKHRALAAKKRLLTEKNMPYLVVPRNSSSQEFQLLITREINRLRKENGL